MIASALATLGLALCAMLPGPLLARGERLDTARLAALATASLAVTMMATALVGAAVHALGGGSLPTWTVLPVSLALAGLTLWLTRGRGWQAPEIEWPGVAVAALLVAYGAYTYAISFAELPGGALRIHAWYNADWFKHLGHTFALADYGVPARDIFASGRTLHYYWLFYVLPGAGTALGGDGWTALFVANSVVAFLLWLTFYGAVRAMGLKPLAAALTVLATTIAVAPLSTWIGLLQQGAPALLHGFDAPLGPPFLSFALYIPQHSLAVALLLGWITLAIAEDTPLPRPARLMVLGGLATLMTVSTLFGAAMLAMYGVVELWRRRLAAMPELAAMAALAGGLVLALGVIKLGQPGSALASPALADFPSHWTRGQRVLNALSAMLQGTGLPLFVAAYLALKWRPQSASERNAKLVAVVLVVVPILVALAAELVMGPRLAQEIRIRVVNLPTISVALIGGCCAWRAWLAGGKARHFAIAAVAALVLVGAPAAVLRTQWHANSGDRFLTVIPGDDLKALAALRAASGTRDVVWQYPEKPYLSDFAGRDSWSAVVAGRTNVATERATDYPAALPDIERALRWFGGADEPVPVAARWVYLSRALHPPSYDALVARLSADPGWARRTCYADACLFSRVAAQ